MYVYIHQICGRDKLIHMRVKYNRLKNQTKKFKIKPSLLGLLENVYIHIYTYTHILTYFKIQNTYRQKTKEWKKCFLQAETKRKQRQLFLYQTKQTLKTVARDKEAHYTMMRRSTH